MIREVEVLCEERVFYEKGEGGGMKEGATGEDEVCICPDILNCNED